MLRVTMAVRKHACRVQSALQICFEIQYYIIEEQLKFYPTLIQKRGWLFLFVTCLFL